MSYNRWLRRLPKARSREGAAAAFAYPGHGHYERGCSGHYRQITKKNNAHQCRNLTFAPVLVSRLAGMKREVRCKSGAIPVAVRGSSLSGCDNKTALKDTTAARCVAGRF